MAPGRPRSRSFLERALLKLSIPTKMGIMVFLLSMPILVLLAASTFGFLTVSSMRAYINGEGLWSKAQKHALYRLNRYARLRRPEDYQRFLTFLAVPLGDRQAREELEQPDSHYEVVYQGFLHGGIHPADIPGMIKLFKRFQNFHYMKDAIADWRQGDAYIDQLKAVGDRLYREISSGRTGPAEIERALTEADRINEELTPLEMHFSATLGEAARWLRRTVLWSVWLLGIFSLALGLTLALWIGRQLMEEIRVLRSAAARVATGDYSVPIASESRDEIGDLSHEFQRMAAQRQAAEEKILELNRELSRNVADLNAANKELESFSYSVSHDLRAPLRSIDGFSAILEEDHAASLGPEGKRLLGSVRRNTALMGRLIEGLLTFSRLTQKPLKTEPTDMTALARSVADELTAMEKKRPIEITVDPLGSADCDPTLMRQVFANLIGNAIKFTRGRQPAEIRVGRRQEGAEAIYFVQDNGAGFDSQYAGKLFGVFQRLHSADEFEGTGIGLALVQRIVRRHGGRIWAAGAVNQGATFSFTLPVSPLS